MSVLTPPLGREGRLRRVWNFKGPWDRGGGVGAIGVLLSSLQ